ncbi:unnamed protein product [Discosporangium mesarthrocarpum]
MEDIPYLDELQAAVKADAEDGDGWLRVIIATTAPGQRSGELRDGEGEEEGGGGRFSLVRGRPDVGLLRRVAPDLSERHVFMCGPGGFMASMDGALQGEGVLSSRIHSEEFYF